VVTTKHEGVIGSTKAARLADLLVLFEERLIGSRVFESN
jgi:hypothetical protein